MNVHLLQLLKMRTNGDLVAKVFSWQYRLRKLLHGGDRSTHDNIVMTSRLVSIGFVCESAIVRLDLRLS